MEVIFDNYAVQFRYLNRSNPENLGQINECMQAANLDPLGGKTYSALFESNNLRADTIHRGLRHAVWSHTYR